MKPLPKMDGETQCWEHNCEVYVKADDYAALNDYAALVQMERDSARAEVAENDGVIRVWRRRAETAEAEVERLRAELAKPCTRCHCLDRAIEKAGDPHVGVSFPTDAALPEG